MEKKVFCFIYLFLFSIINANINKVYKAKVISHSCIATEVKIKYYLDNEMIGFISYTQIPFYIYAIHSFFIYPQFRNKGYGKELLIYTLELLEEQEASLIFIQPGPFEINNHYFENLPPGEERLLKINLLIKLYQSVGFKTVHELIAKGVTCIYILAGINENPKYLMFQ